MPKSFLQGVFSAKTVSVTFGVLAVIGVLLSIFLVPPGAWAWKFVACGILSLTYLLIVVGAAAYRFYYNPNRKIRVIRQVEGRGIANDGYIVVFENPGYLRDNVLLTLYSDLSGTELPIAILQVTKALPGEDVQACAYPLGASMEDIGEYFDARNKTTLYAVPLVQADDLGRHMVLIGRRQAAVVEARREEQRVAIEPGPLGDDAHE